LLSNYNFNDNDNDNGNGNGNDNNNDFNRISRIVPDQVGYYARTATPSGRMIPDQSDERRAKYHCTELTKRSDKGHTHQRTTSSCSFKNNSGFPFF
jgi:hypothetical protein